MKKKIYLAGPMTGLPDSNYPAFHREAAWLRSMGLEVVNPAETKLDPGSAWAAFMGPGIAQLVTCDGIHLLAGWERSRGAALELHIAASLGLTVTLSPRVPKGASHGR